MSHYLAPVWSPRISAPPANLLDSISIILGTPPFICGLEASDESYYSAPIGPPDPLWLVIGSAVSLTPWFRSRCQLLGS